MMQYIIETVIPAYAQLAALICTVGMVYMTARYTVNRLTMPREPKVRSTFKFNPKPYSIWTGLSAINWETWRRYWFRANPVTAVGHLLYHLGFFSAMGIYGVVMVLCWNDLATMPFGAILLVADWFSFRAELFGTSGWMFWAGQGLYAWFGLALIMAVIGMSIPFIMTALGKRGMIRALDEITKACGVCRTDGLKTRNSIVGIQRKVIGLMALLMDTAMLVTFFAPIGAEASYVVHAIFGATIVASLPFSFLFHEIWRFRMWDASVLWSRRITAS